MANINSTVNSLANLKSYDLSLASRIRCPYYHSLLFWCSMCISRQARLYHRFPPVRHSVFCGVPLTVHATRAPNFLLLSCDLLRKTTLFSSLRSCSDSATVLSSFFPLCSAAPRTFVYNHCIRIFGFRNSFRFFVFAHSGNVYISLSFFPFLLWYFLHPFLCFYFTINIFSLQCLLSTPAADGNLWNLILIVQRTQNTRRPMVGTLFTKEGFWLIIMR